MDPFGLRLPATAGGLGRNRPERPAPPPQCPTGEGFPEKISRFALDFLGRTNGIVAALGRKPAKPAFAASVPSSLLTSVPHSSRASLSARTRSSGSGDSTSTRSPVI